MNFSNYTYNLIKIFKRTFNYYKHKIIFKIYKKSHFIGSYDKASLLRNFNYVYPEKLGNNIFLLNKNLSDRYSLLIDFVKNLKETNINILEIGGGANPQQIYLNEYVKKNIKSYILETRNFCSIINEKIPKKYLDSIFYTHEIEKIDLKKIDIAIFTSSIQYLEDYNKILNKINNHSIKYIIITESIFTNFEKDIFVLQKNLDFPIPCCWISKKKFLNILNELDYKLIKIVSRKKGFYKHNIIKSKNFATYDLIFSK